MSSEQERAFCAFVDARGDALLRAAVLLTGDRHAGEDLLQLVLLKVLKHWNRIAGGDPVAYARRVLATTAIDESRRRRWREVSRSTLPDTRADEAGEDLGLRDELLTALRALPPRQRAVLVLRYYDDLTEVQVATELGISVGTVKSAAFRGLAALRDLIPHPTTEHS